jgi:hypothetical protein
MAGLLRRKLADLTTGEELADIQTKLDAAKIPMTFQIRSFNEVDFYRVFVYFGHLEKAKEILRDSRREVKG